MKKKPAAPATEDAIASVTVAAERPTNRIDRQVYDVKSDISTSNSSAADVRARARPRCRDKTPARP